MGNLVTNLITVSGSETDLKRIISLLTETNPDRLLITAASHKDRVAWTDLAPWRAVPEPDLIAATRGDTMTDLGLAVLSREGVDHLRLKQGRDPALLELPPEVTDTAEDLLRNFGLDALHGDALRDAAETRSPGCLDAARRAIAAFDATGEFGWYDWRMRNWGVRAFGPELRLQANSDGSLSLRFDSVNDCPVPFLYALLSHAPEAELSGAALDEDGGFAVFLATDGTELLVSESCDEEEMARAHEIIYGSPPEGEDDDPEP